jgi:hypothetical protein
MVSIVARLRDRITSANAAAMALNAMRETVSNRLAAVSLESVVPGRSARSTPQARIALWLSGVSMVVLLIATANVGTLLLLRAAKRRRDFAVRITLGAGPSHLARQMLVESLLLALGGSAVGLVLARWFAEIVRVTLLPTVATDAGIIDWRVLVVSLGVAGVTGLLAGVAPLARLAPTDLSVELRAGGGHGSSGRFGFQPVLLAVQVALSMLLLIGAGLFVRSLHRVQSQDRGCSTARLLEVTLDFRQATAGADRDRVHIDLVRRVASVPGVTGVSVVQGMPFSSHNIPPIHVPGYTMPSPTAVQLPIMYASTPEYLDMMGVRAREGRLFTSADTAGTPLVVLVNETMARTMWPNRSAFGVGALGV